MFEHIKLKELLKLELRNYYSTKKEYLIRRFMFAEKANIYKFQTYLRKAEYYKYKKMSLLYLIYLRKKNKLGSKLGISINCGSFEEGLYIAHSGCIVVNGEAKIGKNCVLHGSNCIGNKNDNNELVPKIGDNFSLGFGSVVYGKVSIVSNVIIGVNSVVTKDIDENGIYIGAPAKKI